MPYPCIMLAYTLLACMYVCAYAHGYSRGFHTEFLPRKSLTGFLVLNSKELRETFATSNYGGA